MHSAALKSQDVSSDSSRTEFRSLWHLRNAQSISCSRGGLEARLRGRGYITRARFRAWSDAREGVSASHDTRSFIVVEDFLDGMETTQKTKDTKHAKHTDNTSDPPVCRSSSHSVLLEISFFSFVVRAVFPSFLSHRLDTCTGLCAATVGTLTMRIVTSTLNNRDCGASHSCACAASKPSHPASH